MKSKAKKVVLIVATKVSRYGNRRFEVPSSSRKGKNHGVVFVKHERPGERPVENPFWFCPCEHFIYQRGAHAQKSPCNHIKYVVATIERDGIRKVVAALESGKVVKCAQPEVRQ